MWIRLEAEVAANKICAGELDVLTLTSADRTAYVRSMEMLKPLGTPLEMVVMQFVEAEKLLHGRSFLEAAKFYTRHHPGKVATKKVSEAVAEMVAAKQADGLSDVYVRDLKWLLGRFADAFKGPINIVLSGEIQDYLRGIKGAGRSRNNTRKGIQTLFHYAQSRGYLPKGMTEADDLPLAEGDSRKYFLVPAKNPCTQLPLLRELINQHEFRQHIVRRQPAVVASAQRLSLVRASGGFCGVVL